MIEAVLWDFGGVLTTSPFAAFNRFERARGLPQDFLRSHNAREPETNAWALFESDRIGFDEFDRRFEDETRAAGHPVRGADVVALLQGELRPAMVAALKRCARRLRVGCITNTVRGPGGRGRDDPRPEIAAVFDLFEVVIESTEVGLRKPDPRIYALACDRLGVEPQACVFLDDLGVNLKPARAMGMTTIKVGEPKAALRALEVAVGFPLGE